MVALGPLIKRAATATSLLVTSSPPAPTSTSSALVGKLPVLGYNTWNAYGCNINADIILANANAMISSGLFASGYTHMNIDDCWQMPSRDGLGHIVPDPVKFPNGIKGLAAQLKTLGFTTGLYSDNGFETCGGYPGSYGHELVDARDFVSWGITLLKFDNCHMVPDRISRQNEPGKYAPMRDAIAQVASETGVTIMLNLCEWGLVQPWTWAKDYGTSWRATNDINATWASVMEIADLASFVPGYTDFYGRNDFDILEVGNGPLTFDESKSHFTIWALTKSPLLLGTNLTTLSPELLAVVKNPQILAINQDEGFGRGVVPFRWEPEIPETFINNQASTIFKSNITNPAAFWSGPTSQGTVVMFINTLNSPAIMSFDLVESAYLRAGMQYIATDLYSGVAIDVIRTYVAPALIPAHGVVALMMTENGAEPLDLTLRPCQASQGLNCQ